MIVTNNQPRLTHQVVIHSKSNVDIEQMCTWCHKQFGRRFSIVDRPNFGRDGAWQCVYDGRDREQVTYIFSFDHEQDAVLFALRWA